VPRLARPFLRHQKPMRCDCSKGCPGLLLLADELPITLARVEPRVPSQKVQSVLPPRPKRLDPYRGPELAQISTVGSTIPVIGDDFFFANASLIPSPQLAVPSWFQTTGPAGENGLAVPILTGLYAAVVERRRPKARWWAGCAIALTGEVVLIAGRAPAGQAAGSLGGDLLVVLSTLLAAMGYVAGARMSQASYASIATTLWGVAAGSVLIAPIFPFAAGGWSLPEASPVAWGAIATLAWATSIIGYIGWYWALARGGIARIGTIQFLQPLSGLVLAYFLLAERPSLTLIAATALILTGVVVARSQPRTAR
jgi:drug/metabolite transporter (DMT)-like permease